MVIGAGKRDLDIQRRSVELLIDTMDVTSASVNIRSSVLNECIKFASNFSVEGSIVEIFRSEKKKVGNLKHRELFLEK